MANPKLIIQVSIFLVLFGNIAFFKNVTDVYPLSLNNVAFLGSLAILLASLITLLLTLVTFKYTTKPALILILLLSSLASYFMDSYSVVIDHTMIQNIVQTNVAETMDLFSFKLVLYFLVLGVFPSLFIYKATIKSASLKAELAVKLKIIVVSLLIMAILILVFSRFYSSFFREHKPLRYYINPASYIYSTGKYIGDIFNGSNAPVQAIGLDAKIPHADTDRELIILVVGEAARADRFSINGYPRETNPLLKKEDIINFSNMWSCGTSTAVSVPCMFSVFGRDGYSDKKAKSTQNLIDVLSHAGVHVLWRDNNSDSKGVATGVGVTYEDFKNSTINPVCDVECRDEGMLAGLQEYIAGKKEGDIFIVLHQMGNHGPAYYKRYPEAFERFKPACKSSQLEQCTREEISNAYDNAILYTDYFLSRVIGLLKQNSRQFETAMIYMSDHGESLGENGLYLHGLPYFMAPDSQKHIGAVMWFGESFHIDKGALRAKSAKAYSHDHLFHTILGLTEVDTLVYDKKKDIINSDKQ